jgi:PspAA-like protein
VIVRILGEGQRRVDDAHADLLNGLDSGLERAVEAGDETSFRSALTDLLAQVRTLGEPVPDDELVESDALLPAEDATLQEVREMLSDSAEGLIPG